MDAQAELSWMMRKEMTFRSVQGQAIQAIQAIQRGDSQIVTVMPTGAGKSMLFVARVLRTPRGDHHRIRWAAWEERASVDGASIVLVLPEKAVSPKFGTFIKRLKRLQLLDRIVIDECHVILNDELDIRKMLQELGKLSIAETQMVLLTTTLPPHLENKLFERMFWQREEVTLIRGSTVRPNIVHSVVDGRGVEARKAQLESIVTETSRDPTQPEGKVAVMCGNVAGIEQIGRAGQVPCKLYHAGMSDAARAEVLEQFRSGGTRAVVATGAFGIGIDIPDIQFVVFVDEPRSTLDYAQTSGRRGRDGSPSRAIIIRGGLQFHDPLVQHYMDGQVAQCRRIAIDRDLDRNLGRVQQLADEQPCDNCQ
ncbi:hypothetical protein LTR56_020749 [Elasticomyces elasticus]|nr:hypothetical protein LTR22_025464 [Elasticomyces elasticus]KAK3624852.1 hypothetical protein LTR56_020749 [Elasticomyces elasticus]KAK4909867.1 hypothetical protein LTR49_021407 [Elasticomyces elasticus]